MASARLAALFAASGTFMLAACETTPEQQAEQAEAEAAVEAEIALRKGEAVNRVCPRGSDDWTSLGDDALLFEAGDETYMVELLGTCDPESTAAAIVSRGSAGTSCIERGDQLLTGGPRTGERCTITGIYEWDEDAELATD